VEARLRRQGRLVILGGDYDGWDVEVRAGRLSAVRILLTLEEHGQGRQMVRFRAVPRVPPTILLPLVMLTLGTLLSAFDHAAGVAAVLGSLAMMLGAAAFLECAAAMATARDALDAETG
jgi:hypothetical protein